MGNFFQHFLNILKVFARCRQSLKLHCNKTCWRHWCVLGLGRHGFGNIVRWSGNFVSCWGFVVAFSGVIKLQTWLTWCQIGFNFDFKLRSSWNGGINGGQYWALGVLLGCQCGKNVVNSSVFALWQGATRIERMCPADGNLGFWALPYIPGSSSPLRL